MDRLDSYEDFVPNFYIIVGGYGLMSNKDRLKSHRSLSFGRFRIFYTQQQFQHNFYIYKSNYGRSCAGDSGEYDYNLKKNQSVNTV